MPKQLFVLLLILSFGIVGLMLQMTHTRRNPLESASTPEIDPQILRVLHSQRRLEYGLQHLQESLERLEARALGRDHVEGAAHVAASDGGGGGGGGGDGDGNAAAAAVATAHAVPEVVTHAVPEVVAHALPEVAAPAVPEAVAAAAVRAAVKNAEPAAVPAAAVAANGAAAAAEPLTLSAPTPLRECEREVRPYHTLLTAQSSIYQQWQAPRGKQQRWQDQARIDRRVRGA